MAERLICPQFEEKAFYSIDEIADMFLCSKSKIRHDAALGLITPIKVKPMIFARGAIDEYIEKGTQYQRTKYEEKRKNRV